MEDRMGTTEKAQIGEKSKLQSQGMDKQPIERGHVMNYIYIAHQVTITTWRKMPG